MDVTLAWRMIRRWWWVLIAATVVGGALGYGLSLQIAPTHEAKTTLLVTQRQTEGVVQLNDIQTAERMANTFSRLVTLRPVLQQAITDGELPLSVVELDERIAVANPAGTQLLEVSARADDPEVAARMANTVAAAFISSNEAERTARPGTVSVVEDASPPEYPVAPRSRVNAVLAAMLAIGVAGAVILLVEYLDDTIKGPEQAQEITGLPTLGRIERFEGIRSPREQLQSATKPRSTVAEAYAAWRAEGDDRGTGPVRAPDRRGHPEPRGRLLLLRVRPGLRQRRT